MQLEKLKKVVIALMILIGLNACMTNINGDFCLIYEPVFMDYDKDTPETIRQVDRNNTVYDDLCGGISKP